MYNHILWFRAIVGSNVEVTGAARLHRTASVLMDGLDEAATRQKLQAVGDTT
jgi:hypothetical protein